MREQPARTPKTEAAQARSLINETSSRCADAGSGRVDGREVGCAL
jgi:hypothetical protein